MDKMTVSNPLPVQFVYVEDGKIKSDIEELERQRYIDNLNRKLNDHE